MNASEIAEGFKKINEVAMKALEAGNYEEAIAVFLEGLELEKKLGLVAQIAESHANIGNTYFSAGELDEALDYLMKARDLFQKAAMIENVISVSLSISTILDLKGESDSARKQLDFALRIARTGKQRGMIFYRIAYFDQSKGYHFKAQESYGRALMEIERLNRKEDLILCLLARASLFTQMDRQTLASRDIARAKSIAQSGDSLMNIFLGAISELGFDK